MCGIDVDTTHAVCTSGLEIELYPQDPRMSSLALLEPEIPYPLDVTTLDALMPSKIRGFQWAP